jgi:uncharacterized protein YukJ
MTLPYGVLRCRVVDSKVTTLRRGKATQYHLNVLVDTGIEKQRIAINIGTNDTSDTLYYRAVADFEHAVTADLAQLPVGLHALFDREALPALDFVRSDISGPTSAFVDGGVVASKTRLAEPGDTLVAWLDEAKAKGWDVFAFGRYWDDSQKAGENAGPKYWKEESGRGIHDIHMNQGSTGAAFETRDDKRDHNEVWQDGAIVIAAGGSWRALFSAFAGQCLPTNDTTGNPKAGAKPFGVPSKGKGSTTPTKKKPTKKPKKPKRHR